MRRTVIAALLMAAMAGTAVACAIGLGAGVDHGPRYRLCDARERRR